MGGTFIITLREGFEAALILGIVYTYLQKIGARRDYRYVTLGGTLGVLASVGVGLAVTMLSGPLLDLGPDLIGVAVALVAVVLLTWHGYWMQQHARAIKGEVQRRIDAAHAAGTLWVIGLIAFAGVFREGAETVLFLWGLLAQAASGSEWGSVAGGVLGVAGAAALGWGIFRGSRHISLPRFFAVTSVLLLFLAAGMLSSGVGKLHGLGFLPSSSVLWDSSFVLSDQSLVGGFLGGLVGYRARPTLLEVAAYVGYLLVVGALFWNGWRSPAETEAEPAWAGDARQH